jgi:hypothetical protein
MRINHRLKSCLNSKLAINHWINCKTGQLSDIDTATWPLRISMLQFRQWIKIKTKGWIHKMVRKIQAWIGHKLTDKAIKELYSLLRGTRWTQANRLATVLPDTWATSIKHNNHPQLCLQSTWTPTWPLLLRTMLWSEGMAPIFQSILEPNLKTQVELNLVSKMPKLKGKREA